MNILVSACLLGQCCRYDGKAKEYPQIHRLLEQKDCHVIPVCPEQMGGMQTPRDPAERQGDLVVTACGQDVTAAYERGARETLKLAELYGCRYAVLKENSPSCGYGRIYDGTFQRNLITGKGVTAELLEKNGIQVVGESRLDQILPMERGETNES